MYISSECSAQGQDYHCKLRYQGCSSAQRQFFTGNSGNKVAVLLGMNGCSSFPLLSAPHSLLSIWTDLERSEKIPEGTNMEVRRVDLVNWTLRTSPKFTTGVKYQLHEGFDQIRNPEFRITFRLALHNSTHDTLWNIDVYNHLFSHFLCRTYWDLTYVVGFTYSYCKDLWFATGCNYNVSDSLSLEETPSHLVTWEASQFL